MVEKRDNIKWHFLIVHFSRELFVLGKPPCLWIMISKWSNAIGRQEIFFFCLSPRSDCGGNDSYPKYGMAIIAKLDSGVEYLMLNDFSD